MHAHVHVHMCVCAWLRCDNTLRVAYVVPCCHMEQLRTTNCCLYLATPNANTHTAKVTLAFPYALPSRYIHALPFLLLCAQFAAAAAVAISV